MTHRDSFPSGPLAEKPGPSMILYARRDVPAGRGKSILGREVFAGCGGLIKALRRHHVPMDTPVEAFPGPKRCVKEDDLRDSAVYESLLSRVRAGCYRYLHFGLPCSSWSAIQRMNRGTRTKLNPEGNGSNPKEIEGNLLASRVAFLCKCQHESGGYFSVENPDSSMVWDFPPCLICLMLL